MLCYVKQERICSCNLRFISMKNFMLICVEVEKKLWKIMILTLRWRLQTCLMFFWREHWSNSSKTCLRQANGHFLKLWALIGSASQRHFLWIPTTYVFVEKQEKYLDTQIEQWPYLFFCSLLYHAVSNPSLWSVKDWEITANVSGWSWSFLFTNSIFPKIRTPTCLIKWHMQTVHYRIKLFLKAHSDWDLNCFAIPLSILTLVLLKKLRCHAHFQFTANQITWSRLLIQIHILNGQLIWIYTVCKSTVYRGSARQGLRNKSIESKIKGKKYHGIKSLKCWDIYGNLVAHHILPEDQASQEGSSLEKSCFFQQQFW